MRRWKGVEKVGVREILMEIFKMLKPNSKQIKTLYVYIP